LFKKRAKSSKLLIWKIQKEKFRVDELEALVALTQIPYLGSVKIRLLINYFGSAVNALQAEVGEVAMLRGFGPQLLSAWGASKAHDQWQRNLELAAKEGVQLIPYTSDLYPKQLLKVPDFPVLLYNKGLRDNTLFSNVVAIVGTRLASEYGKELAETLACDLAAAGMTVISGLAKGIDSAAHRGALKTGKTIAVLGSGLMHIYPRENSCLAEQITQTGALLSEFSLMAPPERRNFLLRNRIVSGLAQAVVLIEAPEKSGAMHTMRIGWSQGKKLFVTPGRDDEKSQGNRLLLQERRADLVENAQDIIRHLSIKPQMAVEQQLRLPI